jgi:hypothetical protein
MRMAWAMFGYPNFYDCCLRWYMWGWPVLSLVFGIGVLLFGARFISRRGGAAPSFMLGTIFLPALAASFFQPNDDAVRYTFHLYPLMVVVFAVVCLETASFFASRYAAAGRWQRRGIAAAVALLTLLISQDANPVGALSVGDWTNTTPRHPIRTIRNGWGPRHHPDYKTPSLYVRERLAPGDRVVVLAGPVTVVIYDFYIGQVDYALASRQGFQTIRWSEGKLVDRYVGAEILTVKFMITDRSLQKMVADGVPETVLKKLALIKDQEFNGEVEFLRVLRKTLGVEGVLKRKLGFERTRMGAERGLQHRSSILTHSVRTSGEGCCGLKQIVEGGTKGNIWLLGNWNNLMADDRGYADPSKEYLRRLIRTPDCWGLDGQTFAVKIQAPEMPFRDNAA